MPRYEFAEGASNKFWEIALDGSSFTTTYGRIGTDGQTTVKEFDSPDKAQKEHDKLVAEKVKKGYVLVDGGGAAPAAPAPKAPPAKPSAIFDDEGDEEEAAPPPKPVKAKPAAPPAPASSKQVDGTARYFELVEGTSSKFWEITLGETSFKTRYGKIGTDGQTTVKDFASAAHAQKEHDKLVLEKTKKGYLEK